jgi:hypothetical protein
MTGLGQAKSKGEWVALFLVLVVVLILFVLRVLSDGILEMGDGVNHYLIARYSWQHPEKFLDLWGKPLFTLLASPFAQFGHIGVAVFDLVVVGVTGWLAIIALRSAGVLAQLLVPFLVLLPKEYVLNALAGMTEPLFGLLTILTLVLFIKEWPVLAAAVASLTPLSRPEYVVFVPLVAAWLLLDRKWSALPWLLLGSVVYALLAWIAFGDPFWFWAADPYGQADGFYGSGPWDHFLSQAERILGWPLLVLVSAAMLLWPVIYRSDLAERRMHTRLFLIAGASTLGVFMVHSILWWKGWRGSAGLLRVVATIVPLSAVFTLFTLGRGGVLLVQRWRWIRALGVVVCAGVSVWCVRGAVLELELPYPAGEEQLVLERAASVAIDRSVEGDVLYSTHPFMAFGTGRDPYDKEEYEQIWSFSSEMIDDRIRVGDKVLWDAQLGPTEAGIPEDEILGDERFEILGLFAPRTGWKNWKGQVFEVILLERRNTLRWFEVDTFPVAMTGSSNFTGRADTIPCADPRVGKWCLEPVEFPFELNELPPTPTDRVFDEWILSGDVEVPEGNDLHIVLKQEGEGQLIRYEQEAVVAGRLHFSRKVAHHRPNVKPGIYFWNYGKGPVVVKDLELVRKRWYQSAKQGSTTP